MCAAIASTGTRLRWASKRPLIRCRLPGPQLPAQTASSPVRCGLGAGGERGGLLVADVDPGDLAALPAQRVGEAVERVARQAVDPVHSRAFQQRHHRVSHAGSHRLLLSPCHAVLGSANLGVPAGACS